MMTESLIRYLLTVGCIITITWLIYSFFEWGPQFLVQGVVLCTCFLLVRYVREWLSLQKDKKKE